LFNFVDTKHIFIMNYEHIGVITCS
jgi:hypothetical protein